MIVLVTDEQSRLEADPDGSPLEGVGALRRVDWTPAMGDEERAALFDAA